MKVFYNIINLKRKSRENIRKMKVKHPIFTIQSYMVWNINILKPNLS